MKRLKKLRLVNGMDQKELAEKMGVHINTISRYETGDREPDLDLLKKMADYFEVSVDYLLERTEDPTIPGQTKKNPPEPTPEDLKKELVRLVKKIPDDQAAKYLKIIQALLE